MAVLEAHVRTHSRREIVQQLLRLKFQVQIVEARIREDSSSHADLLADIADETEKIIEELDQVSQN